MIDRDMVDELIEVLGDGIHRLIAGFEADSGQKLEALRAALNAGRTEEVRQLLHSLRGSSSNLGMQQLAALCGEFETGLPGTVPDLGLLSRVAEDSAGAFRQHLSARDAV